MADPFASPMKTSVAFWPEAVGFTSPQPPLALGPAFLRLATHRHRLGLRGNSRPTRDCSDVYTGSTQTVIRTTKDYTIAI